MRRNGEQQQRLTAPSEEPKPTTAALRWTHQSEYGLHTTTAFQSLPLSYSIPTLSHCVGPTWRKMAAWSLCVSYQGRIK